MKLLVVEDEARLARRIGAHLGREGFEVDTTADGADALRPGARAGGRAYPDPTRRTGRHGQDHDGRHRRRAGAGGPGRAPPVQYRPAGPRDRRHPAGARVARRSQEIVDRVHSDALAALPERDRTALVRAMKRLVTSEFAEPAGPAAGSADRPAGARANPRVGEGASRRPAARRARQATK